MSLVSTHDVLRKRLLTRAGIDLPTFDITQLRKSEWCYEFEQYMRNRLLFGAMRYGQLGKEGKPQYDRISDMIRRLQLYMETGNQEHLVDVANLCLCEYVEGVHPNKHFASSDDGIHTEVK
jgi:hypothetical protein